MCETDFVPDPSNLGGVWQMKHNVTKAASHSASDARINLAEIAE